MDSPGCIRTYSGRRLSYDDPQPEDIFLIDILVGICHEGRFAGQLKEDHWFSVGDHSARVTERVWFREEFGSSKKNQFQFKSSIPPSPAGHFKALDLFERMEIGGLPDRVLHCLRYAAMHDGPEAFIRDLPRPLKRRLPDYSVIENRLDLVMCDALGLKVTPAIRDAVLHVDLCHCATEMRDLRVDGYIDPGLLADGYIPYDEVIVPRTIKESFAAMARLCRVLGLVSGRHDHPRLVG